MEFFSERLHILFEQEKTTYATRDYLHMSSQSSDVARDSGNTGMYTESSSPPSSKKRKLKQDYQSEDCALENKEVIHRRMIWREKACEWAYRGK